MTAYVIRQINPRGLSARADEATTVNLTMAALRNEVEYGVYLQWSDPDARGGRGDDHWTRDIAKAKRFTSWDEAFECWRAQSRRIPLRPDGQPNRPMTAYSITIDEIE